MLTGVLVEILEDPEQYNDFHENGFPARRVIAVERLLTWEHDLKMTIILTGTGRRVSNLRLY